MKRWPKRLKIGAATYRVLYREHCLDSGDAFWGQSRHAAREIVLSTAAEDGRPLAFADRLSSLLHEWLHCELRENRMLLDLLGRREEPFITSLTADLARFLVDNRLISQPEERKP